MPALACGRPSWACFARIEDLPPSGDGAIPAGDAAAQDDEATLSTGLYYEALVPDDAWLYAFSLFHHRVWRVAKTGGPFIPFMDLPPFSFPKLVAMIDDASNLYVASETAIWRHSK